MSANTDNLRCAINGFCPVCDREDCDQGHEYADNFENPDGIHCACTGCAEVSRDYGCTHDIRDECTCVNDALYPDRIPEQ